MTQIVQDALTTDPVAARLRAEGVLKGLLQAKAQTERELTEQRRPDALRLVTGRSSLDNAIDETRRMIDLLDRACAACDAHEHEHAEELPEVAFAAAGVYAAH